MSFNFYVRSLTFFFCFFSILNANARDFQVSKSQVMFSDEELSLFMPVDFTGKGVNTFLRSIYNKPAYAQELLPNNFDHVTQFLAFGSKTKQKEFFIKSVMRLFSKKLKAAPYVNAYAYVNLLEKLPKALDYYVQGEEIPDLRITRDKVGDLIYQAFVSRFSLCKANPEEFLGGLSDEILEVTIKKNAVIKNEVSKEQIRQLVIRFLEIGLSKLVWSAQDYNDIWDSVKHIGQQLAVLHEHHVIGQADDLDDLYWSLVNRFCYFIDLTAEDLPVQFYAAVKKDIAEHAVAFLVLEEQESAIEAKAQTLMRTIMHGEARSRAHEKGLVLRA